MPYARRRPTTRRRPRSAPRSVRRPRSRRTLRRRAPRRTLRTRTQRAVATVSPLAEVKRQGNFLEAPNNILNSGGSSGDAMGIIAMGMGTDPIPGLLLQYPQRQFMKFDQGVGPNERLGRSLFVKSNTTHIRLEMLQHYYEEAPSKSKLFAPQYCRVMLVKGKQVQGNSPNDITKNMFYNTEHNNIGINGANSAYKLQKYTINRSRWNVLCDKKFCLGPSQMTASSDPTASQQLYSWTTSKYPVYKDLTVRIPVNQQVRYNDDTSGIPSNYDDAYFLIILNTPIGAAFDGGGTAPTMTKAIIGATISASTQALDL